LAIARATGRDAAALRDLHTRTWADTYASLLPEDYYARRLNAHRVRDWEALIREQEERGGGVLVARGSAGLAGLCQYGPSDDQDEPPGRVGQIFRLYVLPACQRQGVGRLLLATSAELLVSSGASSLTLWALEADRRARGFYERLGWRLDGARRFAGAVDVRYRREQAAEAD